MPKMTRVEDHLSLEEIKAQLRSASDADKRMRWQIIYTIAADPRDGSLISKQLGCSRSTVSNAVSEYNLLGKDSFSGPGSGSNRSNYHMSESEEAIFISSFKDQANKGLVCTISEIKHSYEKYIGSSVPPSTITRLLSRHGWRKIDPRPMHPKSSKEKQETFKKTLVYWLPMQ